MKLVASVRLRFMGVALIMMATVLLQALPAVAQAVDRTGWIPSGHYDEGVIGDMWTFTCPPGGRVTVFVNTKNDTGTGQSNIDPSLEVVDADGNLLGTGNENVVCNFEPVCAPLGGPCPLADIVCGSGNPHTITIYSSPSDVCVGGGGYELSVLGVNRRNRVVRGETLNLGGGPVRTIPNWAGGVGRRGPALDDEGVPSILFPGPATFTPTGVSTEASESGSETADSETTEKRKE